MVRATAFCFYERGFDPRLGGVRSFVTILHRNRPTLGQSVEAWIRACVVGKQRTANNDDEVCFAEEVAKEIP
ncbi:hypothetical protein AVEN_239787-1 [Araneus ventricosus]|uniref:Uncharacterized protein n=1 Tax=Araneus ventricosus TaxID=182803 RepID=A0A4Y2EWW4_ARAVE|nr:hypothetical protein AVEN_239787-1 [Araneus ventricosus]